MRPGPLGRLPLLLPLLLSGLGASWAEPLAAQGGSEGPDRPRIGLVLGGGGARGFAHLGVLEVLHELRVPVDFVVGTSMGAVVGGLWATGAPIPDVVRIFRRQDWDALFRDAPPRRTLPLRRKRDDRAFQMGLDLGVGLEGLRLPVAAISGARLTNALEAYAWPVRGITDFDRLPIPFRAVATDVETGERVVLDGGSLVEAIRGSMAVPGIFTPGRVDGRLLVDGGLVLNLPVSVARTLEPDLLIVVDVSRSLDDLPEPRNVLGVLNRSLVLMTGLSTSRERASLGPEDVLVAPEMPDLASTDFAALEEGMRAGREAARAVASRLGPLSLTPEAYEVWVARRARRWVWNPSIAVREIRVDTTGTVLAPSRIRSLLPVEDGEAVPLFDLPDRLARVLGDGGLRTVRFDLEGDEEAATLVVAPVDKPWGPTFVRADLALADRGRGEGSWQLRVNLLRTHLSPRGGEAEVDLELGRRQGVEARVDLPLTGSGDAFVGGWVGLGRSESLRSGDGGVAVEVEVADRGVGLFAGVRPGTWGELRVGVDRVAFDVDGAPDLPVPEGELSFHLRGEVDLLDRVPFPSSGGLMEAELRRARPGLGAEERFDRLEARGTWAWSRGRHTVRVAGRAVTGFGDALPFPRRAPLGGWLELTALEPGIERGSTAAVLSLIHAFRPGGPASGDEGRLRVGLALEAGRAWEAGEPVRPLRLHPGGSVWIGAETPVGPAGVAWGWLQGHRPTWLVRVGFGL